jgi:predicted nucleotide-binding protein (sugar kinase/HSP70/actin superfamily)
MISGTGEWKDAVEEYIGNVNGAFDTWKEKITELETDTGLNNLEQEVKNINTESDNLLKTLVGEDGKSGLIGEIKNEFTAVSSVTGAYAA